MIQRRQKRRALVSTILLILGLLCSSTGMAGLVAAQGMQAPAAGPSESVLMGTPTVDGVRDASYVLLYSDSVGSLYYDEDSSYYYFLFSLSRDINENVFAPQSTIPDGWTEAHYFPQLTWYDACSFKIVDCDNNVISEFRQDYLYGSPGSWASSPEGDDGTMIVGNASDVTSSSSMVWNLNNSDFDYTNGGLGTADWISPPEGSGYSWQYAVQYEFRLPKTLFSSDYAAGIELFAIQSSPSKTGETTYRWNEIDVPNPGCNPTLTPTLTLTPTETSTATATSTPTETSTPTATVTETPTLTPTDTVEPTPTDTVEPTPTDTVEPTPTDTVEPTPTDTVEPTPTDTVEPTPTDTVAPTATNTVEPTPTDTVEPTATNTTVAPTPTNTTVPPTPTATPLGGGEPTPTPTGAVDATATAVASPTATPLGGSQPSPTPGSGECVRSYITVVVWGKIPVTVDLYVAGQRYDSQLTAANSAGEQQATFIVWPGEDEAWNIRIEPQLPAGLDPTLWGFVSTGEPWQFSVMRCEDLITHVQLVSLSESNETVTPTSLAGSELQAAETPTLAAEQLPVTGALGQNPLLHSIWLLALGLMFVGAGGVLRVSSRDES